MVAVLKGLLAIQVAVAFAALLVDAKMAEAAVQEATGVNIDLSNWSPATVLVVCSVVFSFGTSWQTIRVHGKVLKDFEAWRQDVVNPKLSDHQVAIEVLKSKAGTTPWNGRERRSRPRGNH